MANNTNSQIGSQTEIAFWKTLLSPPAYEVLGQVISIGGIGVMKPEVPSTTLESTGVERIGGLPDGKEVSIVVTTNATNLPLFEGWVNGSEAIDLRVAIPEPTNQTRYFSILPLDYDMGTITPSGLMDITLKGRITGGAPSPTDPHA